jgi:7,8-dihydroneopterin aldolase/epimerase/oxygenase
MLSWAIGSAGGGGGLGAAGVAMPTDAIFLEGLQFYGYHGVAAEERALGQRFAVDVELALDLRAAGRGDDLGASVDYGAVHERVRAVVEGPPRRLIEAVAEAIADALLAAFPVEAVVVTVRKPAAPIPGAALGAAGVRIRRARAGGDA